MAQQVYDATFGGTEAENYERYFVPTIGRPLAEDLIQKAALRPGERVLDVACGTGVVTRLAAEVIGPKSKVAGLDVNPGMLDVARSVAPEGFELDWYETSAEATPLPDDAFDVVLCQMGLQFMPDKLAALREMKRILAPGGRLVLNVPGPTPRLFAIMAEGLGRHIHPACASFPDMVFSLHDAADLRDLIRSAGFRFESIDVHREIRTLPVPPPKAFLWQYVHCTPLANPVSAATEEQRRSAEREIEQAWQELMVNGTLSIEVGVTTACAAS
jgi:ubiquinone/menaquinone biosynthesis C-methylase UbiE